MNQSESTLYCEEWKKKISWIFDAAKELIGIPGVYAIHSIDGKVLYVGQSVSLGKRVKDHLTKRRDVEFITYWEATNFVSDMNERDSKAFLRFAEALIITSKKPLENTQRRSPQEYIKTMSDEVLDAATDWLLELHFATN